MKKIFSYLFLIIAISKSNLIQPSLVETVFSVDCTPTTGLLHAVRNFAIFEALSMPKYYAEYTSFCKKNFQKKSWQGFLKNLPFLMAKGGGNLRLIGISFACLGARNLSQDSKPWMTSPGDILNSGSVEFSGKTKLFCALFFGLQLAQAILVRSIDSSLDARFSKHKHLAHKKALEKVEEPSWLKEYKKKQA